MPVAESLFNQLNEALAGGDSDSIVKGLKVRKLWPLFLALAPLPTRPAGVSGGTRGEGGGARGGEGEEGEGGQWFFGGRRCPCAAL